MVGCVNKHPTTERSLMSYSGHGNSLFLDPFGFFIRSGLIQSGALKSVENGREARYPGLVSSWYWGSEIISSLWVRARQYPRLVMWMSR